MNESATATTDPQRLQPLIVLDRDGVINRDSSTFIKSPDEWCALPGSSESIARLTRAGFTVVVATNQSGIGRGLFSYETLEEIHNKMLAVVTTAGGRIDSIFFCPHKPDTGCDCRKPKPGLLQQIAEHYGRSAAEMIIVGDSLRDLEAAWAFKAKAILVRTGNGQTTEKQLPPNQPVEIFDNLTAVTDRLIADNHII